MKTPWLLITAMAFAGCAKTQTDHKTSSNTHMAEKHEEEAEPGEVKIPLDQTPPAVRKTIEQHLVLSLIHI